jgi:hypothetical protein
MHLILTEILPADAEPRAITGPPPGLSLGRGSLTEVLKANPAFVNALLPKSQIAITLLNKAIKQRDMVQPSATTTARKLFSTVAQAVDRGVLYLYGYDIYAQARLCLRRNGRIGRRIAAVCDLYTPPRSSILRSYAALGWFYLLGQLDPIRRGFRPLSDIAITALPTRPDPSASTLWLASLIPKDVADEIADLLRAVRDCRTEGTFRANPVFGGTGAVIGSDGDWITGDTLVELKCAQQIKREYVAQLICYYALDQLMTHRHEPYGFSRLALCLPRQRCTIVGSVDEWLAAFGGPSIEALPGMVRTWCIAC